jgi:hypothetical protein
MKGPIMKVTMKRKDWGSLLNGTGRVRANEAVLETIGKARWTGKTHEHDNERLTIELTDKEVAAIFDARGDGFRHSRYLNTRRMYQQVARIYKAFGFQAPYEHLPHDVLKVRKPKKNAVGLGTLAEVLNGTFVPHTKDGKRAYTRWAA